MDRVYEEVFPVEYSASEHLSIDWRIAMPLYKMAAFTRTGLDDDDDWNCN